jgi:tRNA nucleotidyltransferase (CCA-adding enzyme)
MQVYQVGGAVRDELLGEPVTDRDWVVVGATPQQMVDAGYRPVGRDFPVFLHPQTHEEYALARTERKSGRGYRGFTVLADPAVTLEQDLSRRDLTINAMARAADGTLIDPYGGRRDLADGILRHVSPAFAEDPVRLLRLARFAARWPAFAVADETLLLLRRLVNAGELDALVPERVWQELSRGLGERRPSRMLEVLKACGALAALVPDLDRAWGQDAEPAAPARTVLAALDEAARRDAPGPVRFALLAGAPGDGQAAPNPVDRVDALGTRWRVPQEERELARLLARESAALVAALDLDAEGLVGLLARCDAWRRPGRLEQALLALECLQAARPPATTVAVPRDPVDLDPAGAPARTRPDALARVRGAWQAARAVDTRAVSARAAALGAAGAGIGHALFAARVEAVDTWLTRN